MVWYNNPDAVAVIHDQMVRRRMADVKRYRLIRLVSARI